MSRIDQITLEQHVIIGERIRAASRANTELQMALEECGVNNGYKADKVREYITDTRQRCVGIMIQYPSEKLRRLTQPQREAIYAREGYY